MLKIKFGVILENNESKEIFKDYDETGKDKATLGEEIAHDYLQFKDTMDIYGLATFVGTPVESDIWPYIDTFLTPIIGEQDCEYTA
jgi:hypothetical protein